MPRAFRCSLTLLVCLPVIAACGPGVRRVATTPTPPEAPTRVDLPPVPPPVVDPVVVLIAASEGHFQRGRQALTEGHVAAARQAFDRAVGLLLESPEGGRSDPRIRAHFDRLIDQISAFEVKALAEGDGFTEKQYEPASIDDLLALSATLAPPGDERAAAAPLATDFPSVEYDLPIPLNRRVLAFIELFQGRLHDFLQEGMRRGSKYLPMIQAVLRAEGLPLDLAYVPLVESAFKPNALSRARAKGVWQFMRGTGLENGLRQDWYIDERSDPEKATVAAAKYLGTLGRTFKGDWHLALASYNGGPGRLQRAIKKGGSSDFWKLATSPRILPRETRDYVPMILAAIVIARNPAQFGFSFDPEPHHAYETVTLFKPVDLRRIAEWADTSIDQIQALNPELRRWTTPVREDAYTLKVPVGTSGLVQARLTENNSDELASLNWYAVKKGETLATIARKLGVSRSDLAEANYLRSSSRVAAGRRLVVPREAKGLMAARSDRPIPLPASVPPPAVAASRTLAADKVVPAVSSTSSGRVKVVYRVKRGDTLASIARGFSTTVASIRQWNGISGTLIQTGDRLTIYTVRAN